MCVQIKAKERWSLGLCSVICLRAFSTVIPKHTRWVSQDGKPRPAAHLAAQSDSCPMRWQCGVALTLPLLPRRFYTCSPMGGEIFTPVLVVEMYSHYYYLKKKTICMPFFISSREETTTMNLTTIKLRHDCLTPWAQWRWDQAHAGWYSCPSEYDFNE